MDDIHPRAISEELARLIPGCELIDEWKSGPALDAARLRVRAFLDRHTPPDGAGRRRLRPHDEFTAVGRGWRYGGRDLATPPSQESIRRCLVISPGGPGSRPHDRDPGRGRRQALSPQQRQEVETVLRDYLKRNPEFLIEVLQAAEEKQQQAQMVRARETIVAERQLLTANPGDPVAGNPKGDVTVVEFFDYNCPYCKQVKPVVAGVLEKDRKVRIVYKEFPSWARRRSSPRARHSPPTSRTSTWPSTTR